MDAVLQCFQCRYSNESLRDFLKYDSRPLGGVLQLKSLKNDKLIQLIQCTLELKREYNSHCTAGKLTPQLFELGNEQLKLLNRIADGETAWITDPLWVSARQLLSISRLLDRDFAGNIKQNVRDSNNQKSKGDLEEEKYLEKCVRTVHTSFKLCLNDRNPDARQNKKWGVYFFTNLELSIYERLHNRDMVRNLVKVIQSRTAELPTPEQALCAHKAQLVTYYYHMAEFYGCYEMDYERGFAFAQKAWLLSRAGGGPQENVICLLLVPFALLARRWYPDLAVLGSRHAAVAELYGPVVECLRNGDLLTFEKWLSKHEQLLLRRNLYVAMVMVRELVVLKLVKRAVGFMGAGPILSLRGVAAALVHSDSRSSLASAVSEDALDRTECTLASLISKGYVKGYLSHSNRALVVSKTNAFPKLAVRGVRAREST
ncbi:LAME_0H01816g1_1 [Lachancea meyersii CBS 8951]|uniref:LAME_0H01816g1_1 n=1 Tax=Lachancea meyersii CBS 8951 TaxID=1266667 RepID=A0A1G4KDP8_9SACH|nr:LAME_0H01816g1_1 [Lachancea meyersii CBS 8951]